MFPYQEKRDPELDEVLREIARLLDAGKGLHGLSQDAHPTIVEAIAAPYALVFLMEIRRLDELLRRNPCCR